MSVSSGGVGMNVMRFVDVGRGINTYSYLGKINEYSDEQFEGERISLRQAYSYVKMEQAIKGDDVNNLMDHFDNILSGKDKVVYVDEGEYFAKTEIDGDGRITYINKSYTDKSGGFGAAFVHELYRDGVVDENNKEETHEAALSHLKMALAFYEYGSDEYNKAMNIISAVDQGDFDKVMNWLNTFDSSSDFWLQTPDGRFLDDGRTDLYASTSDALVAKVDPQNTKEETLVQFVGVKKIAEDLGIEDPSDLSNFSSAEIEEAILAVELQAKQIAPDLTDEAILAANQNPDEAKDNRILNHLLGSAYMKKMREDKILVQNYLSTPRLLDDYRGSVFLTGRLTADNEYEKVIVRTETQRDRLSYDGEQRYIHNRELKPEDNRNLDTMYMNVYDLENNLLDSFEIGQMQTVDIFSTYDSAGKVDRKQSTASGREGNTIISKEFDFKLTGTNGYKYLGENYPTLYATNATTLDGDKINSAGSDGETGGRWLYHQSKAGNSDGCFITTPEQFVKSMEFLASWGVNAATLKDFVIPATISHKNDHPPIPNQIEEAAHDSPYLVNPVQKNQMTYPDGTVGTFYNVSNLPKEIDIDAVNKMMQYVSSDKFESKVQFMGNSDQSINVQRIIVDKLVTNILKNPDSNIPMDEASEFANNVINIYNKKENLLLDYASSKILENTNLPSQIFERTKSFNFYMQFSYNTWLPTKVNIDF